jgi:hypothetical protein
LVVSTLEGVVISNETHIYKVGKVASLYVKAGRPDSAEAVWGRAVGLLTDADRFRHAVEFAEQLGNHHSAATYRERHVAAAPSLVEASRRLSRLRLQSRS